MENCMLHPPRLYLFIGVHCVTQCNDSGTELAQSHTRWGQEEPWWRHVSGFEFIFTVLWSSSVWPVKHFVLLGLEKIAIMSGVFIEVFYKWRKILFLSQSVKEPHESCRYCVSFSQSDRLWNQTLKGGELTWKGFKNSHDPNSKSCPFLWDTESGVTYALRFSVEIHCHSEISYLCLIGQNKVRETHLK